MTMGTTPRDIRTSVSFPEVGMPNLNGRTADVFRSYGVGGWGERAWSE